MVRTSWGVLMAAVCLGTLPEAWSQASPDLRQDARLEGVVLLNDGARVTNSPTVQVKVLLKDPVPADLEMALSVDPKAPPSWKRFVESQPFDLPANDGEKTVLVQFRNAGGKIFGPLRATIVLDTTPPEAKIQAPENVSEAKLLLSSDVPDAVAMQWAEDVTRWGPWEIYQQPREIDLSAGDGPKTVLVRYRDEAGNISKPATLRVELKTAPIPEPRAPGLRQVDVTSESSSSDRLALTLSINAVGIREMALQLDREETGIREPFDPKKRLSIPRTGGIRRIHLKLWDEAGKEHAAELAFLEAEFLKSGPVTLEQPASVRKWSLGATVGVLPRAVEFNAVTPGGIRKINPDLLGMGRLSISYEISDPLFGQVAFEAARGGGLRILSGTLDLGAHVLSTDISGLPLGIDVEAGALFSKLRTTVSDFGSFDSGIGFRAGLAAHLGLSERWRLDASADYRDVSYKYSGTVLSGDTSAHTRTGAFLAGLSFRF